MTIRAVVVGIDHYDEPDWDRTGPVANAVAVARWLVGIGVAPADIHLFLSPEDRCRGEVPAGCTVRDASDATIRNFLAEDLATGCPSGSQLFFYWSGHGASGEQGQRLLFGADYRRTRPQNVFNVDGFFSRLRSSAYACYDEMIALLDVCGVRTEAPVAPPPLLPAGGPWQPRHLVYYATPEGAYALADTGVGAFTYSALAVLGRFGGWPDLDVLGDALDARLRALDLPRFRLRWQDSATGGNEGVYGKAGSTAAPATDELIETLLRQPVAVGVIARYYRATTRAIGGRIEQVESNGITGMVRELAALADGGTFLSSGLTQFLLRLATVAELADPIARWRARYPTLVSAAIEAEETRRLALEGGRKLLLLVVDADDDRLTGLGAMLRNRDLTLIQGITFPHYPLSDWATLRDAIVDVLARLKAAGLAEDLEVHVFADVGVVHHQFHALPGLETWSRLGDDYAVVMHYRWRYGGQNRPMKDSWRRQHGELANHAQTDPAWCELQPAGMLPRHGQPWYAGFPLVGGAGDRSSRERLRQLLHHGAPLVYWAHDALASDVATQLQTLALPDYRGMPDRFREGRTGSDPIASAGSLLWDDPELEACF